MIDGGVQPQPGGMFLPQGGGKSGGQPPAYGGDKGYGGGSGKMGGQVPSYVAPALAMLGAAQQQQGGKSGGQPPAYGGGGGKSGGQPPAYAGGPQATFNNGQPYFQPRGIPPWMQPQNPAMSTQQGQYGLPPYATAPVAPPYVPPPPPPVPVTPQQTLAQPSTITDNGYPGG